MLSFNEVTSADRIMFQVAKNKTNFVNNWIKSNKVTTPDGSIVRMKFVNALKELKNTLHCESVMLSSSWIILNGCQLKISSNFVKLKKDQGVKMETFFVCNDNEVWEVRSETAIDAAEQYCYTAHWSEVGSFEMDSMVRDSENNVVLDFTVSYDEKKGETIAVF